MSKTYRELIESLNSKKYGDWDFVNTKHGKERDGERSSDVSDSDWDDHIQKIIKKVAGTKHGSEKGGREIMFHQAKKRLATVMNVDQQAKQLRCITVMPKKDNPIPKAGTKKVMVEDYSHLECIEI